MKKHILRITTLAAAPCFGQSILSEDHADIGVAFEGGAWDLHVGIDDELNPGSHLELEADEVLFFADNSVLFSAPGGEFSFLGDSGDDVWILPQTETPGVLFLGFGAEEINPADFVGDITLSLVGVTGPGDFKLYQTDAFGAPTLYMDSSDGFVSDSVSLSPGGHAHYNLAFTAEGLYEVVFVASGVLNDGFNTPTASDPTTYHFGINQVPEPSQFALLAGLALWGMVWLRERARP